MDKLELQTYKKGTKYSLGQLELDYYHHKVLSIIYKNFNTIYFKGGTCLQKCYGLKRFSEDLDFNYDNVDLDNIIDVIISELDEEIEISDKYTSKFSTTFVIKIKGILYTGQDNSICKVSFDFRKGDIYLESKKLIIRPTYNDVENYFLLALNEEEILAEKVRAIITRFKGRDIFDLVELLYKEISINYDLIEKKLSTYDLNYSKKLLVEKVKEKEKIYENEISKLTDIYSSFKESLSIINEKFK